LVAKGIEYCYITRNRIQNQKIKHKNNFNMKAVASPGFFDTNKYKIIGFKYGRLTEVEVKLDIHSASPVRLGEKATIWDLRPIFSLKCPFGCCECYYFVAPSLTRGRVCNLMLLLVLASAVPRDSRPYFIVPILETPPTWSAGPCTYIPQEKGGPDILLGTEFPFP
jgi:hypothetical protein